MITTATFAKKYRLKYFIAIFLIISSSVLYAQKDSTSSKKVDTSKTSTIKPNNKPLPKLKDTSTATIELDSLKIADSLAVVYADSIQKDSLQKATVQAKHRKLIDTSTYAAIMFHKYYPNKLERMFMINQLRISTSKNVLFYILIGIVAFLALIRISFPKYFFSVGQLFLQTSFRQKQTRDQLLQDNLASLFMNILFICSGGTLIALIIDYYHWVNIEFWWLLLYSSIGLLLVYAMKYLFLLFFGWVFNVKPATDTYLFIVFLTNKILGIIAIPFLFILAFSAQKIATIALTIILILVILLLVYRYVASLGTIRSTLKVNALHFFIYLCAVEVMPLILMYKTFINYIHQ